MSQMYCLDSFFEMLQYDTVNAVYEIYLAFSNKGVYKYRRGIIIIYTYKDINTKSCR